MVLTLYRTSSTDNERSVAETIALMYRVVEESHRHPAICRATREALAEIGMYDPPWRKAQAVWQWVADRVRFMRDEDILERYFGATPDQALDTELLQRPELLLLTQQGDCDCHSMLVCSMLTAAGVECEYVTIAADETGWSHVYAVAKDDRGNETALDTSHGRGPGWEPPRFYRRAIWTQN